MQKYFFKHTSGFKISKFRFLDFCKKIFQNFNKQYLAIYLPISPVSRIRLRRCNLVTNDNLCMPTHLTYSGEVCERRKLTVLLIGYPPMEYSMDLTNRRN